MTKDEIMRMARESGMPDPMVFIGAYERFYALAAAAEREACAKACEGAAEEYRGTTWGKKAEKICDNCADAIRARGDK